MPRQPACAARAVDHADAAAATVARYAPGVLRRVAAAAGELRVRPRVHAGEIQPDQAAGCSDFGALTPAESPFAHRNRYFIVKLGARFSLNARGPSLASSERNTSIPILVSSLNASFSC